VLAYDIEALTIGSPTVLAQLSSRSNTQSASTGKKVTIVEVDEGLVNSFGHLINGSDYGLVDSTGYLID
jgi:hypothetical protein